MLESLAKDASAMEGGLMFHGQLVHAGCEAKVLTVPEQPKVLKSLIVNPSLSFAIVKAVDACEGIAVPVSMVYAEPTSVVPGTQNGIVILTYQ